MKKIPICPECGYPAIGVNEEAVRHNLSDKAKKMAHTDEKWSICSNPACDCSYFAKDIVFKTSDLIKPLFYKDNSDSSPICYCSELTRGEIKNAVKKGCKTISEVQKFTKKNMTGHCDERNPMGKCCKNVFQKTVEESLNRE